jgi:predicted nicotinamide N-methyase
MSPPHVPELSCGSPTNRIRSLAEDRRGAGGDRPAAAVLGLRLGRAARAWRATLLDHPETVRGATLLDFATGSGLVAIAAMKAGASHAIGADIDPFCAAAVKLNTTANNVSVDFVADDLIGRDDGWNVVLAGDVFYSKPFADALIPWFEALTARGATVLVGDPGRAYLPKDRLEMLAVYEVPVTRDLEDAEIKRTTVWRFCPT